MTAGFPQDPSKGEDAAMEVDAKPSTASAGKAEESNVIYLSFDDQSQGCASPMHKCRHTCHIEHIFANLYRCLTSNTSHVCDQTCNQKILYDNHTSICIVSRRLAPLTATEHDVVRSLRRKSDGEMVDSCSRRQKQFFRSNSAHRAVTDCSVAAIRSYTG